MKKIGLSLLFLLTVFLPQVPVVKASNSPFSIDVYLDNAGEDVNSFEGTLNYPSSWSLQDLKLQNPDLLYWIEAPTDALAGQVHFSGIFPGGVNNLGVSSSGILLFSLDLNGDLGYESDVAFADSIFYLNHPTALKAENSRFVFKSHGFGPSNEEFFGKNFSLNYSFVTDPITQLPVLVLDSYRGNLPDYLFEKKEGDFGLGAWLPVDGVENLSSSNSTVTLDIHAPDGTEQLITLRRSWTMIGGFILGILASIFILAHLFKATWNLLQAGPVLSSRRRKSLR